MQIIELLLTLLLLLVFFNMIVKPAAAVGCDFVQAVFGLWPLSIGCTTCYFLWTSGHDNFAVLAVIAGFYGNFLWSDHRSSSADNCPLDPMAGKKRTFNEKGELTGYQDP